MGAQTVWQSVGVSWSETSTRVILQRLPRKIALPRTLCSGGMQTSGLGGEEMKEPFCVSHSCPDSLYG